MVNLRTDNEGGFARAAAVAITAYFFTAGTATALPIGFGRNQADLEYAEITGQDFIVYFDRDTPEEGRFTFAALNAARPHLERWFGVKRARPLPVIMSAVTANASFANFITDALEIQTMGQVADGGGTRALVWHEYTHNMMYRHMDNIFGPPGAILHLPWMPVWFIEGLAETTSVSVGSDFQSSVERIHALTGKWPSYDRMHSLYGSDFSTRGYAAAGAFVQWILKTRGADRLPAMLERFRSRSMPWWWPWAAIPGNGFMPMDDSLATLSSGVPAPADANTPNGDLFGRRLYDEYTAATTKYHRGGVTRPLTTSDATKAGALLMSGNLLSAMRDGRYQDPVTQNGWLTEITPAKDDAGTDQTNPLARTGRQGKYLQTWRLQETGDHLVWMEQEKNVSRFCHRPQSGKTPAQCPLVAQFPETIDWLGMGKAPTGSHETGVFLVRRKHGMTSDRDAILHWSLSRPDAPPVPVNGLVTSARAVSMVQDGEDLVMLASGRNHRWLIRYSGKDGACRGMSRIEDLPVLLESHPEGNTIAFWVPGGYVARKFRPGDLAKVFPPGPCRRIDQPTSPLLEAVRASTRGKPPVSFAEAIKLASAEDAEPKAKSDSAGEPTTEAPADDKVQVRPAGWRPRSVLAFPWIGADDALGPQLGVVSVPLMDHMQNETVRATFLVGVNSRFPNTDVRVISNRFLPTLSVAVFRQQTYNGIIAEQPGSDLYDLSYLDEKGVRVDADTTWDWSKDGSASVVELQTGIKRSELKPYLGPERATTGVLTEISAGLTRSMRYRWRRLVISQGVSGRLAPGGLNKTFDYNALAAQAGASFDPGILKSRLGFGIEGARTRGKARRELQEVYRPLKTFVPGSGGGLQQNSFPFTGEGWLFAGRYGDSQARVKADWTLPLVEDFEKLLWIFYVDRLDFTAFLNYGGAWRGSAPPAGRLVGAHGYNLDLQLDNKGVRFNVGGGIGQVFSKPLESYLTLGFDALF